MSTRQDIADHKDLLESWNELESTLRRRDLELPLQESDRYHIDMISDCFTELLLFSIINQMKNIKSGRNHTSTPRDAKIDLSNVLLSKWRA